MIRRVDVPWWAALLLSLAVVVLLLNVFSHRVFLMWLSPQCTYNVWIWGGAIQFEHHFVGCGTGTYPSYGFIAAEIPTGHWEGSWRFLPYSWKDAFAYHLEFPIYIPGVVLLAAALPSILLRTRRRQRRLLGLCEHCSYDLRGNTSGVCPECGTPIRKFDRKSEN